jgi:hypothetical protein
MIRQITHRKLMVGDNCCDQQVQYYQCRQNLAKGHMFEHNDKAHKNGSITNHEASKVGERYTVPLILHICETFEVHHYTVAHSTRCEHRNVDYSPNNVLAD